MKRVDDFRLRFGDKEYVPIMIGGMGVDISTSELALEAARLGGIGHISDAMVEDVSDRKFDTTFVKDKTKLYKYNIFNMDKAVVQFDLERLADAQRRHIGSTMAAKKGPGLIFVNCMEKLTMNGPKETLRTRLNAALDAGIDGITLSAGLHFGSFALMADHPRFREAKLGIIVSSVRALQIFLRKNAKLNRAPDFVIVEGPLAGGHLGFGMEDWKDYDLHTIVAEVLAYLKNENLEIPVIAAGGVFTGSDAVSFLEAGAAGVQVATRFTVTKECGLPEKVKQEYFKASEEDIIVNGHPVSLYLVVPPSDISRTKPLIRLILNQIGRRLTESLDGSDGIKRRHKLLLMLDEFPALGRLDFFETALAFMAGYGIRSFLIAQSLNQIDKAYGQNHSILDNCHVRVTFSTNDERTAKRVSETLGTATELRAQRNYAGHRLAPWLGHLMVSRQETARPLLTPGEVMQLPTDEAVVMVSSVAPIKAKKLRYYADANFKSRVLPPPALAAGQYADVPPARPDDWSGLAIPSVPAVATSAAAEGLGCT
eukprot:gene38063-46969_t